MLKSLFGRVGRAIQKIENSKNGLKSLRIDDFIVFGKKKIVGHRICVSWTKFLTENAQFEPFYVS